VSDGALVCVDPHNGYIRAVVGGVNQPWERYQFDVATRGMRQPGSTFKLFVYAAALERGDTPYSSVAAAAKPVRVGPGKYYAPKNDVKAGGTLSYTNAFKMSINGAAHNVCLKVGPKQVVSVAQRLGLKGNLRAYASIALGASEATPLEMASAYGVFAARGKHAAPMAVTQIESQEGELLDAFRPKIRDTGLKPSTVAGIDAMTRAVVTSGTGRSVGGIPNAHGKTGTTEDHRDVWFIGYTPELATAVWAGNRDNSRMASATYGGRIAGPIWARFMKRALEINKGRGGKTDPEAEKAVKEAQRERPKRERVREERPPTPAGALGEDGNDRNRIRVTVCADSGLMAGPGCRHRATEEYMLGEQPVSRCTLSHGARQPRPRDPDGDSPGTEPKNPDEPATPRTDPDPAGGQ
jgi:membrane peptidoglycan carboxypeptidase